MTLKIDRDKSAFIGLEKMSLRAAGYWERRDIQRMIRQSPDAFCDELGELIWFVGEEVAPTEFVADRIDLLGVDAEGAAVIIELKRDSNKYQLLQALSYAGMVAKWEPRKFIEELVKFNRLGQTLEQATEELEEVLEEGDVDTINRNQRIVLLAEAFDFEVLVTAEWLIEKYGLDIRCYRLALSKNGDEHLLTCTRSYPPPELTEIAIRRRRKRETGVDRSTDWDQSLTWIDNKPISEFFKQELDRGRPNSVGDKSISFYIGDRRRFVVYAKRLWARVYQTHRFDDDIVFWKERLSDKVRIQTMSEGNALRFYLRDANDIAGFRAALASELATIEFQKHSDDDSIDPSNEP